MLQFIPTELPEVIVVEPHVHRDDRGFFLETYHQQKYQDGGIPDLFVQDNHSLSARGILRGLHAQVRRPQGKLVRAVEGELFDVAVDIRPDSPSFGRWVSVQLSAESHRQLYVPPGFAHGFCVTSDRAQMEYKCTAPYDPDDELTIAWDDPTLAIPWPLESPTLSAKDQKGLPLEAARQRILDATR